MKTLDYAAFATLVGQLHEHKAAENAYLDALPAQVREFIGTNEFSEMLYAQRALLSRAAFGETWPDVEWFLYEWRPGFEITTDNSTPRAATYVINSLDDYLAYAKEQLFP